MGGGARRCLRRSDCQSLQSATLASNRRDPLMNREGAALSVHEVLLQQEMRLGVAESCSGGELSSTLLANSGASTYYVGGVIAYANKVKERLLGVQGPTLTRYGAVSAECALEMADGVRHLLHTD